MRDSRPFVRAALAAAAMASMAALAMASDADERTRVDSTIREIYALRELGPAQIPRLIELLQDPSSRVSDAAASTLSKAPLDAVTPFVPRILSALADGPAPVRKTVASMLNRTRWTDPRIQKALENSLLDPEADVRRSARRALRKVDARSPAFAEGLILALSSADASDREESCRFLEAIGTVARGAQPALLRLLADPEPSVREQALLAVGAVGPLDGDAGQVLRARLQDPHPGVALAAALVLSTKPETRAGSSAGELIRVLTAGLDPPSGMPRETMIQRAARGLANLGTVSDQACSKLLQRLADTRGIAEVERDLKDAVLNLGGSCQAAIQLAMSDPDNRVSESARSVFAELERVSLRFEPPVSRPAQD